MQSRRCAPTIMLSAEDRTMEITDHHEGWEAMNSFREMNDLEGVLQVYSSMKASNVEVKDDHITLIIQTCGQLAKKGDSDQYLATGIYFFKDFQQRQRPQRPSVAMYNCMINLYGAADKPEVAETLLREMSDPKPQPLTHAALVKAFARNLKMVDAERIFRTMTDPDISAYVTMASSYGRQGQREKAKEWITRRIKDFKPSGMGFV